MSSQTPILQLNGAVPDASLANYSQTYPILRLTGSASSVTLDANAAAIGVSTLIATGGSSTVEHGLGEILPLSIAVGKGSNLVVLDSSAMLGAGASDTVKGGIGSTTLQVLGDATLNDASFAFVSSVPLLEVGGSAAITLDADAKATGLASIFGGSGTMTLVQTGNDPRPLFIGTTVPGATLAIATSGELGQDTLSLAPGTGNVLEISSPATISDRAFSHVSGIPVLSLSGSSAVTFGTAALNAGFQSVYGGSGPTSFTIKAADTVPLYVAGNSSLDSFTVDSSVLATDTLVGTEGSRDTLFIPTPATISDSVLSGLINIAAVAFTGGNAASVTLDANAQAAGITTVLAGSGPSTLTQTSGDTLPLLLGSGSGNDLFVLNASQLAADTLAGGGGNDTLQIADSGTFSDSLFATTSSIQNLSLTGADALTLDAAAAAAGITRIFTDSTGSTLTQGPGDTLKTSFLVGGGNNLFRIDNATILGNDSITASGNDTLALSVADTITDKALAGIRGVAALSLEGASSITLGANARKAGLLSVYGGVGGASFNITSAESSRLLLNGVAATDGDNLFRFANPTLLGQDTVTGGPGADTLAIAVGGTLGDAAFANLASLKVLALSGGSSVTLDAAALAAGFETILGGAVSSLTQGAGETASLDVALGAGNDLVQLSSGDQLNSDTIDGGAGRNTVALLSPATIGDAAFAHVSNIQQLSLTAGSAVTLDALAAAAGILTLSAGTGSATVDQAAGDTLASVLLGGGGANLFVLGDASLLGGDTIVGGTSASLATNTLGVAGGGSITDALLSHVSHVGVLSLVNGGRATLDVHAMLAGISEISGGSGPATIDHAAGDDTRLVIDGSANTLGGNLIRLAESSMLGGLHGYAGDTVVGSSLNDTLEFLAGGTLNDTIFSHVTGVSALVLGHARTLASSVVLDAAAAAAGLTSIHGTAPLHLQQKSGDTLPLFIDGAADTLGKNLYLFDAASLFAADSISGSSLNDTVALSSPDTLADSAFASKGGISVLSLTGASAVTLDAMAAAAGISSVFAGDGASTLFDGVGDSLAAALFGGKGNDLFVLAGGAFLSSVPGDTVIGGAGVNSLSILGDSTLADSAFGAVSSVQALLLDGKTSVTLDADARKAGIASVIGGTSTLSVVQAAGDPAALTIVGGAGGSTISVGSAAELACDVVSLVAGASNLLQLAAPGTIGDAMFTRLSGVSSLSLSGSSALVLGSHASADSLAAVFGAGSDTITQTSLFGGALSIEGGSGSDLLQIATASLLAVDTITGGSLGDTLSITSRDTLADAVFANVWNVSVLSLTGASAVTLDAAAAAAGISSVFAGNGASTLFDGAEDSLGLALYGGKGSDLFILGAASLTGGATVSGGAGINSLQILGDAMLADTAFANDVLVQDLVLTGSAALTLDAAAAAAGIATVVAGGSSATLTQGPNDTLRTVFSVASGSANLLLIDDATLLGNDRILGSGADTLALAIGDTVADRALAKVRGVSVLELTGASQITLGANARKDGLASLIGGAGATTLDITSAFTAPLYFDGSSATLNNEIVVPGLAQVIQDTLKGGTGSDILSLSSATSLQDEAFANISGFKQLGLAAGSRATLDALALASGITTLFGNQGRTTLVQTSADTLPLYADFSHGNGSLGGRDLFSIDTAVLATDASLFGAGSTDSIEVTGDAVQYADQAAVLGIGSLILAGVTSDAATLDANALASGITRVQIVSGASSLTQGAGDTLPILVDGSKAASNLFSIDTAVLAADTILGSSGGPGTSTLAVTGDAVTYSDLSNVRSVGVLSLEGATSSAATLDVHAFASGITLVGASGGAVTLTQGPKDRAPLVLDGSAAASNLFLIDTAVLETDASVLGGSGSNTLAVTGDRAVYQDLSNVHAFGVLTLEGATSSSVTLDANALASGITMVGVSGGAASFTQGAGDTAVLVLDGSKAASNLFAIDTSVLTTDASILGAGSGHDTLAVTGDAVSYGDLANVRGVGSLLLRGTSGNSATLDANALASGLTLVGVSGGAASLTQGAGYTGALVLDGSKASSNLFSIDTAVLPTDASVIGSRSGHNTLAVTGDAVSFGDLANIHSVGVLSLEGATSSAATLDAHALASGLTLVGVSGGAATLTQTAADTLRLVLDGSKASSNLFSINTAVLRTDASILGGSGTNTLAVTGDAVSYNDLANVHSVGVLSLEGATSGAVTLGVNALASGITMVGASGGAATFTQAAADTLPLVLDGSNATSNLFAIDTTVLTTDASILGGGGTSTLAVTGSAVTYGDLANVRGVGSLLLRGTSANAATLDANALSGGISLVGVSGGTASLTQGAGYTGSGLTLDGSKATSNLFAVDTTVLPTDGAVVGSRTGRNTLVVTGDAVSYGDLANISSIRVLSLQGVSSSSATLDANALSSGISRVVVAGGAASLAQGAGFTGSGLTLDGSKSVNLFTIDNASLLVRDRIYGSGADTLSLGHGATLTDISLAGMKGIARLNLAEASQITLGRFSQKDGLASLYGGAGGTTLDVTPLFSAPLLADGASASAAGNLFSFGALTQLSMATLAGSTLNDTLWLKKAAPLQDASFANIASVKTLTLSGASSVTLDGSAMTAGFQTVLGGSGNSSITQGAGDTLALDLVLGAGNDLVALTTGDQLLSDTIDAGGGVNTLLLSGGATIGDAAFANVHNVQALRLGATGTSVTLDALALADGLVSVVAAGNSTIDQTAGETQSLKLYGGAGSNLFAFDNATLFADDTIIGGSLGNTVAVAGDAVIADSSFAHVSNVGFLALGGADTVYLGTAAKNAGITTIDGGAEDSTYIQTAGSINLLGGAGNDLVSVSTAKLLGGDTLDGADGSNTLVVSTAGKITDAAFANTKNFEVLTLIGASAVNLGSSASASGILTVVGGAASDTIVQTADDSLGLYIDASTGGGSANLFVAAYSSLVAADTLVGSGNDTLSLANPDIIDGSGFGNLSGFTALNLAGASAATLDGISSAGFATLVGGSGAGSYYAGSAATNGLLVKAGAGSDLFDLATADLLLGGYTLNGGGGLNTLQIGSAATLDDTQFHNVSGGMSVLTLGPGAPSSVTLDAAAASAGIRQILGAADGLTVVQGPGDTLPLVVIGGGSTLDHVILHDAGQLSRDVINETLNSGAAILAIGSAKDAAGRIRPLVDQSFARLSGITLLSLGDSISSALGSLAGASGIGTVSASSGNATIRAYDLVSGNGKPFVVDLSADTTGGNFIAAPHALPAEILVGDSSLLGSESLLGAGGNGVPDTLSDSFSDTLSFTLPGTIGDASFSHVVNFGIVSLNGSSAVTLDAAAMASGISTVIGGTGSTTFTQGAGEKGHLYLDGSQSSADLFQIASPALLDRGTLPADTLAGGAGANTLAFSGAGSLTDSYGFAHITAVQTILLGSGPNTVTAGSNASAAGLQQIVGGSGSDVIDATAFEGDLTLDGGGSGKDSLLGGTGADVFILSDRVSSQDALFIGNFSGSDTLRLSLADRSSYALGSPSPALGGRSPVLFGLYDHGAFVANVSLNGDFTVGVTDTSAFLDSAKGHVRYL